jgi:SAM-dependent methyltransferase
VPPLVDKSGVLAGDDLLRLDLGCGSTKRGPEYVGVDLLEQPGVDLVGDIFEALAALRDERVSEVYSSHFLEHVADLPALMLELERVLAPDGRLQLIVPHFSNPYFYSDPTHRQAFGLYTFSYFAEDAVLRRRVPLYGHHPRLRLEEVRLNFRSSVEFRVRHRLKALAGRLVNRNRSLLEFYEENLAWLFPCYELDFRLRKIR